jgi:hypothetical protein
LVRDFPVIKQVTAFKRKIIEIWKYAIANKEEDEISDDIYNICVKQLEQYEEAVRKEKIAKDSASLANDKLQEQMESVERDMSALPPGAIGIAGGGRAQHSTSLVLGDPASYQYASTKTPRKKSPASSTGAESASKRAVVSQNKAMDSISGVDTIMEKVLDRYDRMAPCPPVASKTRADDDISSLPVENEVSAKVRRLEKRKKNLQADIKFMKDLGQDYDAKYSLFLQICDELDELIEKEE